MKILCLVLVLSALAFGQSASLSPQFAAVSLMSGGQFQNGVFVTFRDSTVNSVGLTAVVGCPDGAVCTLVAFPQTPNAGLIGATYPTTYGEAVMVQAGTAASGVYTVIVLGTTQPNREVISETFTLEIQ